METFSALLAICAGNSTITGEFSPKRPVTRCFGVFFDLRPNKRFNNGEAGDLRRHRTRYGIIVIPLLTANRWLLFSDDNYKSNKTNLRDLIDVLCIISHPLVNSNLSYRPEMLNSGQNRWFFVPCDLRIWRMTLKNFVAIIEFKMELQSRNAQFGSKSTIFFNSVNLKSDRWPWKTIGHLSQATSRFVHHSSSYVNSNWIYGPETAKWGLYLCDLSIWLMTLTFYRDIAFVIGNNSWKFHDDRMMAT